MFTGMCTCMSEKIIGASRSKPHTNHSYEKIVVLMYVSICVHVVIHHPRANHVSIYACVHIMQIGEVRQSKPRVYY